MNNEPSRTHSEAAEEETYSDDFRQTERLQTSDAPDSQKAQDSGAEHEDSGSRTADRWWLRKRIMSL